LSESFIFILEPIYLKFEKELEIFNLDIIQQASPKFLEGKSKNQQ